MMLVLIRSVATLNEVGRLRELHWTSSSHGLRELRPNEINPFARPNMLWFEAAFAWDGIVPYVVMTPEERQIQCTNNGKERERFKGMEGNP
ncbi:hypothetical protein DY000_02037068 [Brassica cretica]|uniref:Uncharacterized protein n=1 Tax=Brassica cretica TaxID=69181 RepID=A0ABQ7BJX3_BRACR|nr:hypothetical protein DY000_02037068 [Brassica cretica]